MNKEESALHPGRDGKGRFVRHNKYNSRPKKANGEMIELNEKHAYRDSKGRWIPGVCGANAVHVGQSVYELKAALLQATKPEDIQAIFEELRLMCLDRNNGPTVQLQAMKEYFDRILGKPTQEMLLEKHTVSTKVNVDLTKLSDQELATMESLLTKTQPQVELLDYKGTDASQ